MPSIPNSTTTTTRVGVGKQFERSWEVGCKKKEWFVNGPAGIAVRPFVQGPAAGAHAKGGAAGSGWGFGFDVRVKVEGNVAKAGARIEKEIAFRFQGERFRVKVQLDPEGKIGSDGELRFRLNLRPIRPGADLSIEGFAGAKGTMRTQVRVEANDKHISTAAGAILYGLGPMVGEHLDLGLTHFSQRQLVLTNAGTFGYEIETGVDGRNLIALIPKLLEPGDFVEDARMARDAIADAGRAVGRKLRRRT